MVTDFLKDRFVSGFPVLSSAMISDSVRCGVGGTTFSNIKRINELFKKTKPSLQIIASFNNKFEEILEEIRKNPSNCVS